MKTAFEDYNQIVASIPAQVHQQVDMQMAVSNRIYDLMTSKGLSKAEFARAIGKRPCEVTKWLSGQRTAGSGQRTVGSEQRAANSVQRAANSEQWAANSEQWATSRTSVGSSFTTNRANEGNVKLV